MSAQKVTRFHAHSNTLTHTHTHSHTTFGSNVFSPFLFAGSFIAISHSLSILHICIFMNILLLTLSPPFPAAAPAAALL